ncbi:MAG: tape measure protein [Propionibacteriaceae bacterium]|nr:tape measure protein [Propionibacteriaceae bacterium]
MANGVELGRAYISILASTNQIAPAVKKQFEVIDSDAGKLGARIGAQISGKLKTALKVGAGAVAGLGALVGGLAIKGGIDRALKIDAAQAKLKGLGHDADSVQAIMKNALASVKGTSFGLGEAATTAAGAVAAGIKPGERLESVLKAVANSAAAAQVDMGEMGGIFNKVASLGKAQNDVLQQVADKGLPIYQALGKQMGLTAEEVFQAASKGKISFEQFEAAMRDASGTVAEEMGQTLPGKFANFKASLSRLGESVVSQALPHIADGFSWLTEKADALGPAAKRVGEALGRAIGEAGEWMTGTLIPATKDAVAWLQDHAAPAVETVSGWLRDHLVPALRDSGTWIRDTLVPALKDTVTWIKENSTWLEPLTAAVVGGATAWYGYSSAITLAKIAAGGLTAIGGGVIGVLKGIGAAMSANPIGVIVTAIAALTAGLVWFFTQTELGQEIWAKVWEGIQAAAAWVVDWWNGTLAPAFSTVWDLITQGAEAAGQILGDVWDGIMQAVAPVIDWFGQHVAPIFQSFGDLVVAVFEERVKPAMAFLAGLAQVIGEAFSTMWNAWLKPVLDVIGATWQLLWGNLMAVWQAVGAPILTALSAGFSVAQAIIGGAMQAIWSVIQTVWNAIRIVIETVLAVIDNAIKTVTAAIRGDWVGVWEGIKNHFHIIWDGIVAYIGNLLNGLVGYFAGVWAAISGAWKALWDGISAVFRSIWESLSGHVSTVIGNFKAWLDAVWAAISGAWKALWDGVQNVATAAWNWISSTASGIWNAIKGTITGIWSAISKAWTDTWEGIKGAGKAAWDWISSTISGVWTSIENAARSAWEAIVTTIGGAWGKIKSTVASPINAVIRFINEGIIGSYNWVADKIKIIPPISGTIPKVKFSRGGILPGQSSWRNGDDQLAWMRRGEGVTVSEALRDPYERTRLLALNKAAMSGMSPARFREQFDGAHLAGCGCGIPHHAIGGVIGFRGHRFTPTFAARILQAEKIAGARMHISQGGFRPRTSYSGTSHAGDALDITGDFRRFIEPLRRVGVATWDRTGKGRWVPHAHGVPLPGHGSPAGSAVWQAQDYLRGGDGLGGRDNGPRVAVRSTDIEEAIKKGADKSWWEKLADSVGETWDKIKNWFNDLVNKIAGPLETLQGLVSGDGPFDSLVRKLAEKLGKDLKNWAAKKLGLPTDEGYATGTRNARPGWAWVGERGPELVNFRGGEQVLTHEQSLKATSGGVHIGTLNLELPEWVHTLEDLARFLRDLELQAHYA